MLSSSRKESDSKRAPEESFIGHAVNRQDVSRGNPAAARHSMVHRGEPRTPNTGAGQHFLRSGQVTKRAGIELGTSTARARSRSPATAQRESYTIAHHVFTEGDERRIMIAALRYLDTFTKIEGRWYFAERDLVVDWSEVRSMHSGAER